MKRFRNILAAVDLASGGQLVCPELSAPNREVVQRAVDVVFMGTRSRKGLGALFIGNTAERLLPELNCSVIAVKPESDMSSA